MSQVDRQTRHRDCRVQCWLCAAAWVDREMGDEGAGLEGKASSWVKLATIFLKASATDKTYPLLPWEQDNSTLFHSVPEP